jgi:hypothetical protein
MNPPTRFKWENDEEKSSLLWCCRGTFCFEAEDFSNVDKTAMIWLN